LLHTFCSGAASLAQSLECVFASTDYKSSCCSEMSKIALYNVPLEHRDRSTRT
jgi:hypothetical protein